MSSQDGPYVCKTCGMSFSSKAELNEHEKNCRGTSHESMSDRFLSKRAT
jgi:hypothetical protein